MNDRIKGARPVGVGSAASAANAPEPAESRPAAPGEPSTAASPTPALPPAPAPRSERPAARQPTPAAPKQQRSVADLFDYVEPDRTPSAPQPGYLEGIVRGIESWRPVFDTADEKGWRRVLADLGNRAVDDAGKRVLQLVHQTVGGSTEVPLTDSLLLGFTASARKIPEDELPLGDARRLGIEELRARHTGALPVWIEGRLGESLTLRAGHDVPLGAGTLTFGVGGGQSADFRMQRLWFVPARDRDIPDAALQLARLRLDPTRASDMREVETGGRFEWSGALSLRVDAGLGLGTEISLLGGGVRLGASAGLAGYATIGGKLDLTAERLAGGRARIVVGTSGSAGGGVALRLLAGAQLDARRLVRVVSAYASHVAGGGDPARFQASLVSNEDRQVVGGFGAYAAEITRRTLEGGAEVALQKLVDPYVSALVAAHAGVELGASFGFTAEYDLASSATVVLPRADLVPPELRGGKREREPVRVSVAAIAGLAYDLAMRGDLRLTQQLALLPGTGVRMPEQATRTASARQSGVEVGLVDFRVERQATDTMVDRETPELGRVRSAIDAFGREYHSIFGGSATAAELRVHSPGGASKETVFFGSTANFSADLVVQDAVEEKTSRDEMERLVVALDVLSDGRLHDDLRQVLERPRDYGRTITNLHVWLGETGLRTLLERDLDEDALFAAVGRAFAHVDAHGRAVPPPWAAPGADRDDPRDDGPGRPRADPDLPAARRLVRGLLELRATARAATTPETEEALAHRVRGFLQGLEPKLTCFAALASLVPERERAVEMRLTAIAPRTPPARFTFIQDGRAAELLYAAGYARTALRQYQRYQAVLDPDTRLRVGSVLGELEHILSSPSPDPWRLSQALRALEPGLAVMDRQAAVFSRRVSGDLQLARAFLDGLPDAATIESVLPDGAGLELATLRLNALRLVSADPPELPLLRATFATLAGKQQTLRRIAAVAPLCAAARRLAAGSAAGAGPAREALTALRHALVAGAPDPELDQARRRLSRLLAAAHVPVVSTAPQKPPRKSPSTVPARTAPSFATERARQGQAWRDLAADARVGPVSYFERTGIVPPYASGAASKSGGPGVVTAAMLREAGLAMAASRPRPDLNAPALSSNAVERLAALARDDAPRPFLDALEGEAFVAPPVFQAPEREALELWLAGLDPAARRDLAASLSPDRRARLGRVLGELEDASHRAERATLAWQRQRARFFADNPRYEEDLAYLGRLLASDRPSLEPALDALGYGRALDGWQGHGTTRVDQVLARLSPRELEALVARMSGRERERFYGMLRDSDMTPATRAAIAGRLVDKAFFFRDDEQLCEALVTGLNAGELRDFFDQLHVDGKLEAFLSHRSFWETLLIVFTFGLARLFLYDNAAALRVIAAQGWSSDALGKEYGAHTSVFAALERDAEQVAFDAAVGTVPMDPGLRSGLKVAHALVGTAKLQDFAQPPAEVLRVLQQMGTGAGRALWARLRDVAVHGGGPQALIDELGRFVRGQSPQALAKELGRPESDGFVRLFARILAEGAVTELLDHPDPDRRILTPAVLAELARALSGATETAAAAPDRFAPALAQADAKGLADKQRFVESFIGGQLQGVELVYGGLAVGTPTFAAGDTISLERRVAPIIDGRLHLDEATQRRVAFLETVHLLQQRAYGLSPLEVVDRADTTPASADLRAAVGVEAGARRGIDAARFDAAGSLADLRDPPWAQARLLESALVLLWQRSLDPAVAAAGRVEAYPGPGLVLDGGAGPIPLTERRWRQMVKLAHGLAGLRRGEQRSESERSTPAHPGGSAP